MGRRSLKLVAGVGLLLGGCGIVPETEYKAIIGAVLIDGHSGSPVTDSVILISGSKIRAAGPRAAVPIPAGSEMVNGAGKFVLPGLIDLAGSPAVNDYSRYGVTYARGVLGPGMARITTLAQARQLAEMGSRAAVGMIEDTEEIDPAWLGRLRDLRFVFAPQLAGLENSADVFGRAERNTKRLASAGVAVAVASTSEPGREMQKEIELLAQAGLSPMEVIAAATRNGALALGKADEIGTIETGKRADLLLLSANPLDDVRNLTRIERVMVNGAWVQASLASR